MRQPYLEPLVVAAQIEFRSKTLKRFIMFQRQELSSRGLQRGFDRVNLHRPTLLYSDLAVSFPTPQIDASSSTQGTPVYLRRSAVGGKRGFGFA